MLDLNEIKNDPLYKALENSGFSAEDIASMVERGDVTFEKSKTVAEMKDSERRKRKISVTTRSMKMLLKRT